MLRLPLPLVAALALLPGCSGTQEKKQGLELEPLTIPERAWTARFQDEAVLVADEIAIEGPHDLIDHVVLSQDPETSSYLSKTIPEGLFQELSAKPEMGTPVQAQLDGWRLAAARRITVLQRPGNVSVVVRARGRAYFASTGVGAGEQRKDELSFVGEHTPVSGN
jgi:hypothetical protein